MAQQDLAAIEKQVEKLVGSCVDDIKDQLKRSNEVIVKRVQSLAKEVNNVRVPQSMDENEIKAIPNTIKQIMEKSNAKIRGGVVEVKLEVRVEHGDKKLTVSGHGISTTAGFGG